MTRASARSTPAVSATPATQRQKLAAATRQRIFRIAIAEFSDKGLSGARVETIASRSKVNIRMIYHYFGGKEALYLEVLEFVLARLREAELRLKLDVDQIDPVTAIVQLYDFIEGHFAAHPELSKLLSFENLNRARVMKRSSAIPEMSSPVLSLLRTVIARGENDGSLRKGMDPLHLYVGLVSLCSFHKSNAFTLSRIFNTDMLATQWQEDHKAQAHEMVRAFVAASEATPASIASLPVEEPTVALAVVGAHLRGQPLNWQLQEAGARFIEATHTAPCYRLYALTGTQPPKPGLVRTVSESGAPIAVEVWEVPLRTFGKFVTDVPAPLGIGTLQLASGLAVKGFICEPSAVGDDSGATEITGFGGWVAYLGSLKANSR